MAQRDRLVLVGEPLHGDDRAEDLVLDRLVVLPRARDARSARRSSRRPGPYAGCPPADTSAWSGSRSMKPLTRVELVGVVDRAEERVLVVGQPDRRRAARVLGERGDEVVVDAGRREHPGRRGAVLAGVEVAGDRRCPRRRPRCRRRRRRRPGALPPSSRCTRLTSVRRARGDLHAGAHRAGDRRPSAGVGCSTSAGRCRGRRMTTLSTPGGRNSAAISASSSVALGRGVARLEHDGVAGGERGRDLPHRHHQRVVPRRDLADDADRLAPDRTRCGPAMYSPAARPSSTRAAPAKKRIWSTIGGISSLAVSAIGLPVFSRLEGDELLGVAPRCASAIFSSACWRSAGVVRPSSSNASAAARTRASTSAAPQTGAWRDDLAGRAGRRRRWWRRLGVDVGAADEVVQRAWARHGRPPGQVR